MAVRKGKGGLPINTGNSKPAPKASSTKRTGGRNLAGRKGRSLHGGGKLK